MAGLVAPLLVALLVALALVAAVTVVAILMLQVAVTPRVTGTIARWDAAPR